MSDSIIETSSHSRTPSKVDDTTIKGDATPKDTEGVVTRRKAAALAAAAVVIESSSGSGTGKDDAVSVEDGSVGPSTDAENAVIPSIKEQQPVKEAAVAAAAALLGSSGKDGNQGNEAEDDAAKALGLDPSPPATVLPASAQPFLADIPVEKPSASEIRRNLTPREARQLAELQYHEQLRAYQRWVAAVADAMRERATATATTTTTTAAASILEQQKGEMEDHDGEDDNAEHKVHEEAFEGDSKRSHAVVVGDGETTVSPARKAPKTSATVSVPRPDQAKEGLTESPSTMLDSANNNATIA
ncbi:hypothetical protein Pmar_PMAR024395 [Perkinsus marinus ATCC 50983]|uniref:Uncharacterized protein n=1 Tax=Perkinsus marinus (strain ATCC 50983 / TXsc) TaxID=423536 RepID=C5KLZ3_PERM5|nr:hypothetical protein Pmar_PMAR024395 [Perkinsus marinus ATCC 50983]EER14508.1 hypothetical protein Pmar_PMAR024395 [Perkinsus marinus ATCC 50983]|eukprot:XP_002782713.1 hypothetical protein Pmar_PMAR024395 [Perkinsus marinus ATCC 50983]